MATIAFCAGQGYRLTFAQHIGAVTGANDRRHTEFAADDRRVARRTAMIGDNARSALHDRHPVGIGHLGHEDRTVPETVDIGRAANDAYRTGRDRLTDRRAGEQRLALLLQAIGSQPGGLAAGLHRLGTRLDNEQFVRLAVLGPFHVHWPAVMVFDEHGPTRQLEHFFIVEYKGLALPPCRIAKHGARAAAPCIDKLAFLFAQCALDDRAHPQLIEQRFEDQIFVGIHASLNDGLAQPPGGADHDRSRKARLRVDREHYTGSGEVGTDHALHADRQSDLQMIEVLRLTVADRAIGKQRCKAAAAGIEEFAFAANIEECLLLAGEAGIRQVFGRRAAAHSHAQLMDACGA